jgi:DNA-binding IscR family transcriptional regulator
VRGVGGGYRFVANPRRLTLLDVIRIFEDLDSGGAAPAATPIERALAQVLAEIDQTTIATLGSVTVATMLRMVEGAASPAGG